MEEGNKHLVPQKEISCLGMIGILFLIRFSYFNNWFFRMLKHESYHSLN